MAARIAGPVATGNRSSRNFAAALRLAPYRAAGHVRDVQGQISPKNAGSIVTSSTVRVSVRTPSTKIVLVPLPPAVGRAIDRAVADRARGPILLNSRSTGMDRHAATRRLRHLGQHAGVRITRPHPHMLRHTFVTTGFVADGSEGDLMRLNGWKSRAMIDRYTEDVADQRALQAKRHRGDLY